MEEEVKKTELGTRNLKSILEIGLISIYMNDKNIFAKHRKHNGLETRDVKGKT